MRSHMRCLKPSGGMLPQGGAATKPVSAPISVREPCASAASAGAARQQPQKGQYISSYCRGSTTITRTASPLAADVATAPAPAPASTPVSAPVTDKPEPKATSKGYKQEDTGTQARTTYGNRKNSRSPQGQPKAPARAGSALMTPTISNAFAIAGDLLSRGSVKLESVPYTSASSSEAIKLLAVVEGKMASRGRTLLALPSTSPAPLGRAAQTLISMELAAIPMHAAVIDAAEGAARQLLSQGAEKAAALQAGMMGGGFVQTLEATVEGRPFTVKASSDPSLVARALMKQLGLQDSVTLVAAGREATGCALMAIMELRGALQHEFGLDCGFTTTFVEALEKDDLKASAFYRLVVYKRSLPMPIVSVSDFSSMIKTSQKSADSAVPSSPGPMYAAAAAAASKMMVGVIMQLLMKRPNVELHLNESDLPFALRSLVRVVDLFRQSTGVTVVAMLEPNSQLETGAEAEAAPAQVEAVAGAAEAQPVPVLESAAEVVAEVVKIAKPAKSAHKKYTKVVILLERTKLPDLSSAILPIETGVVLNYTPRETFERALRAQMLNLGSWAARLESPRALATALAALRGVDTELASSRGTRIAFVPEMVLSKEAVPESQRGSKGNSRGSPQQHMHLHFIEVDSMIMDMLKPRQVTTTYKVADVPHLNKLVRTAALYNSFPALVENGVLGLHAYLDNDNLLHVDLCKDPLLPSGEVLLNEDNASAMEAAWPMLMVAASTNETALARGVLAEVLQAAPGECGVTLRTGNGEPVKVSMVATAMAAPPLQDQTNSRILVVPKVIMVQEDEAAKKVPVTSAAGDKPRPSSKAAARFAITLLGLHRCPLPGTET